MLELLTVEDAYLVTVLYRANGLTARELARRTERSLDHTRPRVHRLALAGWVEARAGELASDPNVWRLTHDARAIMAALSRKFLNKEDTHGSEGSQDPCAQKSSEGRGGTDPFDRGEDERRRAEGRAGRM